MIHACRAGISATQALGSFTVCLVLMAFCDVRGVAAQERGAPPPDPVDAVIDALPPPAGGAVFPPKVLPADAPQPSANPRNFDGTWSHDLPLQFRNQRDLYGEKAPFNMAGAKLLARRVASLSVGTPYLNASALCRPTGQLMQFEINTPFQIYSNSDEVEFHFMMQHATWSIPLSAAAASTKDTSRREYMGQSIGHWDGDTLVVETTGLKQGLWLDPDGTPVSTNGKLTQRIRKVLDEGAPFLEFITVIDDPTYYRRPWALVRKYAWRPDQMILSEYNCEEQVGDKNYVSSSGLIPEPAE